MSNTWVLGITLIILLSSIFLISSGTTEETSWLWWIGLIMIGVGGLIPPLTRYLFNGGEEEENVEEDQNG